MRTMETYWWIILFVLYLVVSFAEALGIYVLSSELLGIKKNRKLFLQYLLFYTIVFVVTITWTLLFIFDMDFALADILFSMIMVFGWSMIVRRRENVPVLKTASTLYLCTFFIQNFVALAEQFTFRYMISFYQSDFFEIQALVPAFLSISALVGCFLVAAVIRNISLGKYYGSLFVKRKKRWFTFTICFLLGNFPYMVDSLFKEGKSSPYYISFSIFISFIVVLLFLYLAFYEASNIKLKSQDAVILQQQAYVNSLENIQQEMRTFRHDYQNMMSGVYLQANEGDITAVQDFIKQSINYFDSHLGDEIKQITQISNIALFEVKSLILVKQMKAKEKMVDLQIEVLNKLTHIDMGIEDFLRGLGILLDNAVEAAAESDQKQVRLLLLNEKNKLNVIVKNSFAAEPNLKEIWKQGFSTKGQKRGVGLSSYQNIVQRYPNVITKTLCEDDNFIQELKIMKANMTR